MTRKIFRSIVLVAGTVLLASLLLILGYLYDFFGGVQETQLKDELTLASAAVESTGGDYLAQLSSDRFRLTWIAADGSVLYDTQADASSMESHADREEVQQALKTGEGESTRYSATLLQKTLYYARRLGDGTVLRISVSRATAGLLILGVLQPMLLVLAAALILSGVLARRLSKRIVDPLNRLDLDHPLHSGSYEELAPLLGRINQQHREISSQLRTLRRKTDEFDQILIAPAQVVQFLLLRAHKLRAVHARQIRRGHHRPLSAAGAAAAGCAVRAAGDFRASAGSAARGFCKQSHM